MRAFPVLIVLSSQLTSQPLPEVDEYLYPGLEGSLQKIDQLSPPPFAVTFVVTVVVIGIVIVIEIVYFIITKVLVLSKVDSKPKFYALFVVATMIASSSITGA
jgi:hypothetical protein